jgi:putative holliday junction resolvase
VNVFTFHFCMNILSLDFGLKRVGTAVGSTEVGIAFARDVLANGKDFLDRLEKIIRGEKIERVVVGNPHRSNEAQVSIIDHIERFLDIFEEKFPDVPYEFLDERFTSVIATQKLHEIEMKGKEQKQTKDSIAAQIILQEWLDQREGN